MRILLLDVTGFIGKAICQELTDSCYELIGGRKNLKESDTQSNKK